MCIGKRAEDEKGSAGAYRYGFNGKEKDSDGEWGSNTHYDYGFRIYNPSIAKFLSVDPLTQSYPMLTPYQFGSNSPVWAIDLDGLEAVTYQDFKNLNDDFRSQVKITNEGDLKVGMKGSTLQFEYTSTQGRFVEGTHNLEGGRDGYWNVGVNFTQEQRSTGRRLNQYVKQLWWTDNQRTTSDMSKRRSSVGGELLHHLASKKVSGAVGLHIQNSFAHQIGTALSVIKHGEENTRLAAMVHENSRGDGFSANIFSKADSVRDLVNNEFGHIAAQEYTGSTDFANPEVLSGFLNYMVDRLADDIPELKDLQFSADQESVKSMSEKIDNLDNGSLIFDY